MKEQYKHLLNFFANLIMLAVQTALFAYVWYNHYAVGFYLFYRKGHWAVIGFYVLIIFFFTNTFNGYKIGCKIPFKYGKNSLKIVLILC